MALEIGTDVPWNAAWSGEESYEVRPCRHVSGRLALWSPHRPGAGRPIFARPHMVRQRRSIAEMRCTVCGEVTIESARWWFPRGDWIGEYWMSTEGPVHSGCAELALHTCPTLRKTAKPPIRFPSGARAILALVGGAATERDLGIKVLGRRIVGHLKLGWRKPEFLTAD